MYDHFVAKGWLQAGDWERFDGAGKAVARTDTLTQEQLEAYVPRGYRDRLVARARERILDSAAFRAWLRERMTQAFPDGSTVLVAQSAHHGRDDATLMSAGRDHAVPDARP